MSDGDGADDDAGDVDNTAIQRKTAGSDQIRTIHICMYVRVHKEGKSHKCIVTENSHCVKRRVQFPARNGT